MGMEQHTPSLATCQKLREAGFPQDTHLSWTSNTFTGGLIGDSLPRVLDTWFATGSDNYRFECAAPILTEILEQLPKKIDFKYLTTNYDVDEWFVGYLESDSPKAEKGEYARHESIVEAHALLWLELNGGK